MTPEAELLDIVDSYRQRVDTLALWSSPGLERLHALLRIALRPRAELARSGREIPDFPWESLAEMLVGWHFDYPEGSSPCREHDVFEALQLATTLTRVEPLATSIRAGCYRVRFESGAFRVRPRWNLAPEAADIYLERDAVRAGGRPEISQAELDWISSQTRELLNHFDPPTELLRLASDRAYRSVDAYREVRLEGRLPDRFDLGDGLTVGSMTKVITGLMAIADLGELAHRRVGYAGTTLIHIPRATVIELLRALHDNLSDAAIETVIDRVLVGPGRSLRTSFAVPFGSRITLLPLLLVPRSLDAVMLRTAATDPNRFGPVGQQLGQRARVLADWLRKIPGVAVVEGLKLRSGDGARLGDLDVVALDRRTNAGIVFEVKWPIDALTMHEVAKTEAWIVKGAGQLGDVRRHLESGQTVAPFPSGWPDFDGVDWTWCVCTPQQLSARPVAELEMTATSFRYLASLGPAAGLIDVIRILRAPDLPIQNRHFTIESRTIELGRHKVCIDGIVMEDMQWSPAYHRTALGDS